MKKLLLLISVVTFSSCEKESICLKCEQVGKPTYTFCDGDVDASVAAYNLTQKGYYCEQQ